MTELLTAAQMRAIERAAIESGAVTGLELMERAGAGAVEAISAEWPDLDAAAPSAVVLCGPGNNGGDGFIVARMLATRGWAVEVFEVEPAGGQSIDAGAARAAVIASGLPPKPMAAFRDRFYEWEQGPRLVVDALFGTGLTRPLSGEISLAVELVDTGLATPSGGARVASLDLPSGLATDCGRVVGRDPSRRSRPGDWQAVRAGLTLAFHRPKLAHFLAEGPRFCGRLRVIDIGLGAFADERASGGSLREVVRGGLRDMCHLVDPETEPAVRRRIDAMAAKRGGHKFDHGHAVVLAGGVGRGGAARMSARAALRVGAGLVTVAPPPAAMIENAAQLDAIMLRAVRDADALAALLSDDRINALLLGPGLGTGARESALVGAVLGGERGVVLDGDALTILSRDDALLDRLDACCILTPHAGEFARLFPKIAERLSDHACSKVDAARDAAARAGCTIVFKGPDTVIADPSGRAAIHSAAYDRGAPWLATAGAGDVLAGLITGLMARGQPPWDAACAAAWLHVECARAIGPGLIAEDLPEALPGVLARLEGWTPPR